jgi:hypothetical protein
MVSLNFPPNPNPGDKWTVGTKTYRWSGSAWLVATQNNITSSIIVITSTTNATSTITGALIVAGGVGLGGDLYIGGTIYAGSVPVLTTSSLGGSVFGGNDITITSTGTSSTTYLRFDNTSTLQTVTNRGHTTTNALFFSNTTESTTTNTGALVVAGGIGVGKRVNCESLRIQDSVFDSTMVEVNTTASTVIDSYLLTDFRAAKYFVQIASGGGADHTATTATFQAVELLLVADNTGAVYATEYGLVVTGGVGVGGALGTFQADLSVIDHTVRLYFNPTAATNKTIKVLRTGMAA